MGEQLPKRRPARVSSDHIFAKFSATISRGGTPTNEKCSVTTKAVVCPRKPVRPYHLLVCLVIALLWTTAGAAPTEKDIARYTELRWTTFNEPLFNPYATQVMEKTLTDECKKLWREGKGPDAISKCKEVLAVFPASYLANRMLADMLQVLANVQSITEQQREQLRDLETKYRAAADGLLQSILASGDGKTEDTAYRVITISEEYLLIWYFGCIRLEQSLVAHGDKKLDALRVRDKDGNERTIYFDVSPFAKKYGG